MAGIVLAAYAKINLTFDITGLLPNGYHSVETVMQSVSLRDVVFMSKSGKGIHLSCNARYVPTDQRNLAYKAAELFFEKTGTVGGAEIELRKKIPVQAGLGGGSSDAAAVLVGLNRLYKTGLSQEELCEMGDVLGADVPFCIIGGTKLGRGNGGELSDLPQMSGGFFAIVRPHFGSSTVEAFKAYDSMEKTVFPDTAAMAQGISSGDLSAIGKNLSNVLEPVLQNAPRIAKIKSLLLARGAIGAAMTGSGSAVFGLFPTKSSANRCIRSLYTRFPFVSVCAPVGEGVGVLEAKKQ